MFLACCTLWPNGFWDVEIKFKALPRIILSKSFLPRNVRPLTIFLYFFCAPIWLSQIEIIQCQTFLFMLSVFTLKWILVNGDLIRTFEKNINNTCMPALLNKEITDEWIGNCLTLYQVFFFLIAERCPDSKLSHKREWYTETCSGSKTAETPVYILDMVVSFFSLLFSRAGMFITKLASSKFYATRHFWIKINFFISCTFCNNTIY